MADAAAAVEFVLESLKQVVVQHAHLISGADEVVEKLDNHLRLFKASIAHLSKQERSDERLKELIRRIRDAVYEAEDIIDAYVTHAAQARNKNLFHEPPNIVDIVEEIEAILEKIRCIYSEKSRIDFADREVEDRGTEENENSTKETNVVGKEDETEALIGYLLEESPELEVISIVGMAGLGKTILAQKIFHDPRIRSEFSRRIWVYASQEFTQKEIFLEILKEFTILTDDIKSKADEALADLVVGYLENERFLLVVDDVWTCKHWDKIKVALPKTSKIGKVLITSRNGEVGRYANRRRDPHGMRFFTEKESYELLLLEVFHDLDSIPLELRDLAMRIAKKCHGHPLAIVLIAGILVKEFSSDMLTMKTTWQYVLEWLSTDHNHNASGSDRLFKFIELSYEKLPHRVRECFLYFGMFPEDFEIHVWKLIRLWVAEGFIQQKIDVSLEETAEKYLEELIDRKLVRAEKFKLNGKVKTCRIHDLIRDFSLREARREGFLQQIHMSSDGAVFEELKFRRLCIHSYILDFVSGKPYGPIVRSLIFSSRDEMSMPMKDLSAIPKGFKLLKVLDVEPINFAYKLPRAMFQLLHLRYLVLSVNLDVLPSAFSLLRNIQTLVVYTSSRTLEIRADIFNLTQLRHFMTNASAALPNTSTGSPTAGEKIQTLGAISPESCTEDVFDRVRNLNKLGVRGKLALLLDGKNGSFKSLGKLGNLQKLKLLNDVFPIPPSGVQLCTLPPPSKFPPNLKILTLSRTLLDWRHMSTIGLLEQLQVLKLKDKAFVGEKWELADGGFCVLEVLHIGRTNLKIWLASGNHFPKLTHLQLKQCDELHQIPFGLADIPTFKKLDLSYCKRAAVSAKEIEAKRMQTRDVGGRFELSVFPHEQ